MERSLEKIIILGGLITLIFAIGCDRKPQKEQEDGRKDIVEADSAETAKSVLIMRNRTLGLAYLEENRLEEAENIFKELIKLAPDEALGYANLGIVYMRMGKYSEAEEQLKKAVELNPEDPDIRLNLAKVYDLVNKEEASREELEKTIEIDPDHVQTLYSLAESYQNQSDEYSVNQWERYLQKIVDTTPTNIVARLYLTEVQIRNEHADNALAHLEEIERISPPFPREAMDYYIAAMRQLKNDSLVKALTSVRIFHNMIKLSNNYQTNIQELKGTTASQVGVPVISFSETRPAFIMEGESLLDVIQFTDVTVSADLGIVSDLRSHSSNGEIFNTHIATGDMDRDGDQDLYVAGYDPTSRKYSHYLFKNEMGRFQDIALDAGLSHSGNESSAIFADYDNDGFLDLYIAREGPNLLYDNVSEGQFEEVADRANVSDKGSGNRVLLFDFDQEGDLDLILANYNSTKVYRNNGDKTFKDITSEISFGDEEAGSKDAVFSDLDDDGDVDLLLINNEGHPRLYFNLRDGNFSDVTIESGLQNLESINKIACGDYNNDGFEDLILIKVNQLPQLMLNSGTGVFSVDPSSEDVLSQLEGAIGHDVIFFDFDNDGSLDILMIGEPKTPGEKGIFLLHNNGKGEFEDASAILPDDLVEGYMATVIDYNEDGDMDILIAGLKNGIRLLRNDGGNANHHLKIQLVGIKTGSGKNNHFGIGAKIEVRAGDMYQMKTVTAPNIHFGLGTQDKVDVVRVLWTNGVPQNIFSPGSDQDLIEAQELKGSCPFLYVWNGNSYEFLKDMMWRSALGMPLGIMGGSTAYAFADASEEYLKIPGETIKPKDGIYSIQITTELWETIYFDQLKLFAIDHPENVDVYVDEKFTGPPFPGLNIYQVEEKKFPRSVYDGNGANLLSLVREKDNRYITHFQKESYQGITEMHDLIMDLGEIDKNAPLVLFLNGWIFPTDASINVAISQSESIKVQQPYLQVLNENGMWETIIENIGFPSGKDKTVIVDLTGKLPDHFKPIIRIRTNMEIYWDYIFYSTNHQKKRKIISQLSLESADLHYRGFSATYRKGGRYGPFWFDYNSVSIKPKWRDLDGYYTRFGDVKSLLLDAENKYVIMNAGDEITVTFNSEELTQPPAGWKRDFIIYSAGWVKDGDFSTAYGNRADPYPYHGMASYPNDENMTFPLSEEMKHFFNQYHTREVTGKAFRNEIRNYGK